MEKQENKFEKDSEEKDVDTRENDPETETFTSPPSIDQIQNTETDTLNEIITGFENDIKRMDTFMTNVVLNIQREQLEFKTNSKHTLQKLRNITQAKKSTAVNNPKFDHVNYTEMDTPDTTIKHDDAFISNSYLLAKKRDFQKPLSELIETSNLHTMNLGSSLEKNLGTSLKEDKAIASSKHSCLFSELDIPKKYSPQKVLIMADGTLCIYSGSSSLLFFIRQKGGTYELSLDVSVLDIAIHPTKRQMYCITPHDKEIREIDTDNGETVAIFDLEDILPTDYPTCISVTNKGEVVVGLNNKIQVYYKKIEWILKSRKELTYTPMTISTCKMTGRIVCFFGSEGFMFTKNTNMSGSTYYYADKIIDSTMAKAKKLDHFYSFVDGEFNSKGNLVIANMYGNKLHMFDLYTETRLGTFSVHTNGQFSCLCQDKEGYLFAGTVFSNKIIKIRLPLI